MHVHASLWIKAAIWWLYNQNFAKLSAKSFSHHNDQKSRNLSKQIGNQIPTPPTLSSTQTFL